MRRIVLLLVGSLLCSTVVLAQAPPAADTYVASGAPTTNYGTSTILALQPSVYTFIRFNTSGIPTNATVQKAVLRLFVSGPSVPATGTFSVYQINTSWAETTLTWNNKPALGSVVGSPVSLGSSSYQNFVVVDITSLVQQWVNGTVTNNGIALVTTTSGASYSFDSKEATTYSHQPELDIAIPGAQGAQGAQGPQGAAGANGQGFNFRNAFSNTTNYNAYDVVTYNGSTYEATVAIAAGGGTPVQNSHWALMAQQGAQGTAGATGPQGATGQQGPTGATGAQGSQGPIGLTGPQGLQGTAGTAGANGQGFNFRNAFSNGTSYNAYDVVTYNGSTYEATVAIAAGQGTPVQNSNWALMAQQGAQGTAGATGPQGASGPQGPTGATGPQGSQGTTGAAGSQGPIGLTGPQGLQGTAGTAGANGQGFTFQNVFSNSTNYNAYDVVTYNGSTYEATVAIAAGQGTPVQNSNWALMAQQGAQGTAGATGPQGASGPQGPTGATGPQGSQGTTGAAGSQGPIGLTGPQGPQGTAGAAGANGQGFTFQNVFSNSTNYNAYDVVTYNGSTYEATVAIAAGQGTPVQNSNWALMAQQGAQGTAGATGPQGASGSQGPTGATGPQGSQGATGAAGSQGPIGLTGPQGPQGTAGAAGANGQGFTFQNVFSNSTNYNAYDVVTYNGSTYEATVAIAAGQGTPVQNSNWALMAQQGAQGTAGATGPQGASGPQGPAGATGAAGAQGSQGTQGPQGPIGLTGPQGPQGPSGGSTNWRGTWNNTATYNPIDAVAYNGSSYVALSINVNAEPDISPSFWQLLAAEGQGFAFRNAFNNSTNYNAYDVATYNGSTYEATVAIAAGGGTPDQNPNWALMAQQGAQGSAGTTGPQGASGPQGPTGAAGPQGASGPQGPAGATGAAGAQGPQGTQGPQGPIGLTGPQGPQGVPGNLVPNSPYYIQNGTTLQTGASFNIDGTGTVGGILQGSAVNATNTTTNQAFSIAGTAFLGIGSPSDQNVFIGSGAGNNNVAGSGISNFFSGSGAGQSNTTGSNNVYNGFNSGYTNTTGAGNVFTGSSSGLYNTGSSNTFFGNLAGGNNTTGSSNVYLANQGCTYPCTESNTIRIGTPGTGLGQQNTTYIAGINGTTTNAGVPVFIDSTGLLGTGGGAMSGVTSFNGRTGAILPQAGDYTAAQITGVLQSANNLSDVANAATARANLSVPRIGDVSSSGAVTAVNGTTLAALPSGFLYNTTGSGIPTAVPPTGNKCYVYGGTGGAGCDNQAGPMTRTWLFSYQGVCQAGVASAPINFPTVNAPSYVPCTGSNITPEWQIPAGSTTVTFWVKLRVPTGHTGPYTLTATFRSATASGSAMLQPSVACVGAGQVPDNPPFSSSGISSVTLAPAGVLQNVTSAGTFTPACADGSDLYVMFTFPANSVTSPINFSYIGLAVQGSL